MLTGFVTTSQARLPSSPFGASESVRAGSLPAATAPSKLFAAPVLEALRNTRDARRGPNFLTSLILAVASLGVLPALLWPMRFRRSADGDRRALLELARWGRARCSETDGASLVAAAERVRFHSSLFTLALAGVVTAVGAIAWSLTSIPAGQSLSAWLAGLTYGAFWPRYSAISMETLGAFSLWTLGLTVAYAAHLAQAQLYALSLRRFLDEFNKLAIAEGYAPVMLEPISFGFSPFILSGAALMLLSGLWAIPMALAGGTDCRVRRRAVWRMRAALSGRVRDMIFARPLMARPTDFVAATTAARRCATDGCAKPLSNPARFCPRCGKKTDVSIDRKA